MAIFNRERRRKNKMDRGKYGEREREKERKEKGMIDTVGREERKGTEGKER